MRLVVRGLACLCVLYIPASTFEFSRRGVALLLLWQPSNQHFIQVCNACFIPISHAVLICLLSSCYGNQTLYISCDYFVSTQRTYT